MPGDVSRSIPCGTGWGWVIGMDGDALGVIACGSTIVVNLPAYLTYLSSTLDVRLHVLLTSSAERFLPRQSAAWFADQVFSSSDPGLNPAEFAEGCRGIVILPATANMLAATALGLAGTPAQTVVLAAEWPCIFFPNMNGPMWSKKTTQRHVTRLREDGHTVVNPQLHQQVYAVSRREFVTGLGMPAPPEAAQAIAGWLDKTGPPGPPQPARRPASDPADAAGWALHATGPANTIHIETQ
jgi:hypothetical protein